MRRRTIQRSGLALAFLLCIAAPTASGGSARKCVGDDGRILFTDQACPPGTSLAKKIERVVVEEKPPPPAAHPRPQPPVQIHPRPELADPPKAVPMMAKAVLASRFARALADLSALKIYSMSYMAESGQWPTEPGQMGLDAASFDTEDILEVGYRRDGGIVGYLAPVFGSGKWLWMEPRSALGGANVTWLCHTNVEPEKLMPGAYGACEWRETPKAP